MITINDLPEQNCPPKLHEKIMRKIIFAKFRTPFLFIVVLAGLNLASSGWHLMSKAAEMQTWSVVTTMFAHFELSLDYLISLIQITLENTPINLMLEFMANLILVYCLINLFKYLKRSKQVLFN